MKNHVIYTQHLSFYWGLPILIKRNIVYFWDIYLLDLLWIYLNPSLIDLGSPNLFPRSLCYNPSCEQANSLIFDPQTQIFS